MSELENENVRIDVVVTIAGTDLNGGEDIHLNASWLGDAELSKEDLFGAKFGTVEGFLDVFVKNALIQLQLKYLIENQLSEIEQDLADGKTVKEIGEARNIWWTNIKRYIEMGQRPTI